MKTKKKEENQNDEWDEETMKDWEEKMSEPLKFRKLSKKEIDELRKQGKKV